MTPKMLCGMEGLAFHSFKVVHRCLKNNDPVFVASTADIVIRVRKLIIFCARATDCPDPDK